MKEVNKQDVQGFILKGYGKMRETRYYIIRIGNADLAKQWLEEKCNAFSNGEHKAESNCLNVAFTHSGLQAIGMADENLKDFSREFREGMDTNHRNRLLGDEGTNHPKNWLFGANKENTVNPDYADTNMHMMVMAFGKDEETLTALCADLEIGFGKYSLQIVVPLEGKILQDDKIHIGFRDGISQPIIEGVGKEGPESNMVATGEFLMGYKNEYGVYPDTPFIYKQQGDLSLLPFDPAGSGKRDLGYNGSYLVYRKMEERVDTFWKYMNENSKTSEGELDEQASIKLASKMIGRWPNGSPITKFPDEQPTEEMSSDDDFGYDNTDRDALKCPFGSHMRRNNPRDSFEGNSARKSLKLTKKHRIIRRGRSYGEPLISGPRDHSPKGDIGLHFMCFNADIAGQFEFIQHTWANFPRFENLYNDPDPITGVFKMEGEERIQNFTIQDEPVNKCIANLDQFVTIKGGAYFFFPSLSAIKYFSTI